MLIKKLAKAVCDQKSMNLSVGYSERKIVSFVVYARKVLNAAETVIVSRRIPFCAHPLPTTAKVASVIADQFDTHTVR